MRWSVAVVAEGDREVLLGEVVELADAVAVHGGIASGVGTTRYGAQLIVEADAREQAVERAKADFAGAAARAGLPAWPIVRAVAVSEDEDEEWADGTDGDG
ncbi:MAG: hypothetical protein ACHQE5_12115 [Actinomycetes bacterium]